MEILIELRWKSQLAHQLLVSLSREFLLRYRLKTEDGNSEITALCDFRYAIYPMTYKWGKDQEDVLFSKLR